MNIITEKRITDLYQEAETKHGMNDGWEIAAYIIDALLPEEDRDDHPSFYYHVHAIWEVVQAHINSTWELQ